MRYVFEWKTVTDLRFCISANWVYIRLQGKLNFVVSQRDSSHDYMAWQTFADIRPGMLRRIGGMRRWLG